MGISPTDSRVIRPTDTPTLAKVEFDWSAILTESLTRSPEILQRKWTIKSRELELIAARNTLLPQVDLVALYRWLGLGDELWSSDRNGRNFPDFDSTAFDDLTEGRFQEWRVGIDVQLQLGSRAAHAAVRQSQLNLAREKARLEDLELEIAHGLTDAVQRLDASYGLTQTTFLQRAAAETQVERLQAKVEVGAVTLDLLLDAQRREADAERQFFQSLLQYNLSILEVHFRKGSLLEYCGVALQEGPWPAKAYFDALIRARQRDASHYLNYGYTRPDAVSRGPITQDAPPVYVPARDKSDQEAGAAGEPLPPGTPEGESLPAPQEDAAGAEESADESAGDQLRTALRSALGVDSSDGPILNTPAPPVSETTDVPVGPMPSDERFDWGGVFE
jgi:hypothetical protein